MENPNKSRLILFNVSILVFFLLLVAGIYLWVSKKSKGEVIFPAGINYLSPKSDQEVKQQAASTTLDYVKLAETKEFSMVKGKVFGYSFQFPKAMVALSFPNDASESITFKTSNVPPELNIMFLVETISSRDPNLVGKQEQFVRDYWKFFSGLKGVNTFAEYQNDKGLKGYKVTYLAKDGSVTTDNYFFVIEGDNDHVLHMSNIFPSEGRAVFEKILNSLEYKK